MLDLGKIIVFIIVIFSGCGPAPTERYYNAKKVPPVFSDTGDKLYFSHKEREYKLFTLKSNIWEKIDTNLSLIPDYNLTELNYYEKDLGIKIGKNEYLSYKNNIVSIKKNNNIVYQDTLPTNNEIISNLQIVISNGYEVEYMPFFTKQYEWDKEKHIVSIATDKTTKNETGSVYDVYKIYYVYLFKDNLENWNYQLIDTIETDKNNANFIQTTNIPHHSLNGKANLCFETYFYKEDASISNYCFVLESDERVYLKRLFGEIYRSEYISMIKEIYKNTVSIEYNYTFDKEGNMHLFYNKSEDISSNNQEYFWYGYFTKENPTVALYEQKIAWD